MAHAKQFRTEQFDFEDRKGHDAIFGADYLSAVSAEVETLGRSKVYLVVSGSLHAKSDAVRKLEEKLGSKVCGKKVGVKSHTPYDEVLQIARETKETSADIIVTLRSRSYTDAAKAARIIHDSLSADNMDVESMEGLATGLMDENLDAPPMMYKPILKLICVRTSLSAGEWTHAAGCTNPTTRMKQHFTHPAAAPNLIALDPQLALTTPLDLWLSTGVRSVDHCVEMLCSGRRNDDLQPLCRGRAEGAPQRGLRCKADETDVSARADCRIGSWKAMRTVLQGRVAPGASHAIIHQLGAFCGVPHGITSCIVLSPVLNALSSQRSAAAAGMRYLLSVPDTLLQAGLNREQADAGNLVKAFVKALGFPTTLTEVGVGEDQWDLVAKAALQDVFGKTNPAKLENIGQVKEILAMAKRLAQLLVFPVAASVVTHMHMRTECVSTRTVLLYTAASASTLER
ncbi:Dehydroquinate synthase-like protein [Daedalea quercina L-15889]|uniref:Dehydroquinate synthase-like protein n=1 Tax=Daedalea quercina L-15889 TaxID=1314783 RepID=A0A165N3P8_9APHY|nr:Dehydroquinate synthase-like protein [Daedalea quercina L-15889]